jgi:glycosyltransferase involved in cell wall biosynthesis
MVYKKNSKISIITPSYNQGKFIEDTILSVLNQDYKNFEHIIIDGGSTDNTLQIIKKYKHLIYVSEADSGQANAINKGFKMASGDIFAWINSDDYYEKNIFGDIVNTFSADKGIKFLYGDIIYVDKNKLEILRETGPRITYEDLLNNPDLVRQPSSFWRRELYFESGGLDENLKIVMDYDLFLKFTLKTNPAYLEKNLSYYRFYPETKTRSLRKQQSKELFKVMKRHSKRFTRDMIWFLIKRYMGSFYLVAKLWKAQKRIMGNG